MGFWIASMGLGAVVALLLVMAVMRRGGVEEEDDGARADIAVYRDQLAELDREAARGVISGEEAARARTEISRRLLEADTAARRAGGMPRGGGARLAGPLAGIFVIVAALGLYWQLGAPGYPDMPLQSRIDAAAEARANRPSQQEAEGNAPQLQFETNPEHAELLERLREALKSRPDDIQGHMLLAQNEARLGNFSAAHAAQRRVLEIKAEDATARDWSSYADLLVLAAGGYVSPEAEQALARALRLDPEDGTARYYSGLMFLQTGRPDLGFRTWSRLLSESDPGDAWVPPIREQIEEVAMLAGVDYALPEETLPGPDAGAVAAAQDMTEEERGQMIRGMVEGLSERLATEGGSPQEWARLINALGVLGETDRARAIWQEARTVFADAPEALSAVDAAAGRAGLTE